MQEDWITTNEAATLTGYHPVHIRLLIRQGEIQGQKWGRDWMISRESLLEYQRRVKTKGEKRGPKTERP